MMRLSLAIVSSFETQLCIVSVFNPYLDKVTDDGQAMIIEYDILVPITDVQFLQSNQAINDRKKRAAISSSRFWENGVIPYTIAAGYSTYDI